MRSKTTPCWTTYFYPRPAPGWCRCHWNFYPRPPWGGRPKVIDLGLHYIEISIHALRGEGDGGHTIKIYVYSNFYPRPPWGGRRRPHNKNLRLFKFLSTPSVGRATLTRSCRRQLPRFLSTPSVGRATSDSIWFDRCRTFLSTPSVGRATVMVKKGCLTMTRFLSTPSVGRATVLRAVNNSLAIFLSTPSVGRATQYARR